MSDDLNTEIKIGADASGVEAGVSKAKRSLKDLGDSAARAGKDAGAGIGAIGSGGDKSAKDVERATKNMQGSLQRLLAEQKAGAKGSREYYEALADTRGISRNSIKPILDQIDAAKSKTLEAKSAADSWQSSLGKVGPMVAAAFSGAAIAGFLGKVVSVQREFDVLNSSLKTVTGSSAAAEKEMAWLKDFAKETPFGLAQATQGFVKMKALGLDPTRAALTSFGNTASAMGKDLNQMIEAVADASTGEFERLKEFGIKAKKDGDQVSLTFQGITTTIRNSSVEITKYLENIGNASFGGAMEERAKTLDGTIAALGDTWDELFRTVSTNNVGSLIFDAVTLANWVIEDATAIISAFGDATADAAKDTGALVAMQNAAGVFFETVAVMAAQTLYILRQTGDTMGGIAAAYKAFFSFDFDAVRAIGAEMKANGEQARREIDATTARILSARKEAALYSSYDTRNASAATDPRRLDLKQDVLGPASPAAAAKKVAAIGSVQNAYASLISSINQKIEAERMELAGGDKLTASQRERIKLDADLAAGRVKLTASQVASVRAELDVLGVLEKQKSAAAEAMKTAVASAAARTKEADSIKAWFDAQESAAAQSLKSAADRITSLEGEEEAARLAAKMNITLAEAIERTTLARLRERQAGFHAGSDGYNALQKEIVARERILELVEQKGSREASEASNKAMLQDWENSVKQYDDIFREGFAGMLNNGEDGWKAFTKSLTTTFKTTVADQIYKMFLRPFVVNVVGNLMGMQGGAGGAMQALASGGGGNGVLGMASNAYSAYGLYNGGMGGTALGQAYAGYTGATIAPGMMGPSATPVSMFSQAGNYAGGMGSGSAGGAGSGSFAGFGTAAAVVAIVSLVANAAGFFKSDKIVGNGMYGELGGDKALSSYNLRREGGSLFGGPEYSVEDPLQKIKDIESRIKGLQEAGGADLELAQLQNYAEKLKATYGDQISSAQSQSDVIQNTYNTLRAGVGDMADALGLGSDAVRAYTTTLGTDKIHADGGALGLKFEGLTKEEISAKIGEALKTSSNEMAEMLIGSWASVTDTIRNISMSGGSGGADDTVAQIVSITETAKERMVYTASEYARAGEQAIDTLTRLAGSLNTVNGVFDMLGISAYEASLAGGDLASKLVDMLGGGEAFSAITGSYYENFYTEAERMGKATAALAAELAKSGVAMPASKDAYRALVEEQLNAGEAGQALAAKLLQLNGAFAQVADYAEQAAQAQADAMAGLQLKLLRAQGNEVAAVAIERQKELAALQAFGPAAVAMQQQIYGIMDAMSALEAGAASYFAQVDHQLSAENYTGQGDAALNKFFGTVADAAGSAAASAAQASADAAKTAAASWRSAAQSIQSALEDLRGGTTDLMDPAARYALTKATLDAMTLSALGGDSDAASKLAGAADDFLRASESGSTTQAQYLRDRVLAEAKLASVMDSAQAQASVQDAIASAAGSAVKQLEAMNANLTGFAATLYELLDKSYAGADKETAGGVASTFAGMQSDFDAYFKNFKQGSVYGDKAAFGEGTFTRLSGDMAAFTGADGVISYLRATESILDIAKRIPELRQAWEQQYGLKLPAYAVGTNYVARTGPALLHEGEAVIPKAFNPWAGGAAQQGGNGELLAELRALRQTNERLEARLASIEESNRDMANLLDNVTEGGNAMRSEVMA